MAALYVMVLRSTALSLSSSSASSYRPPFSHAVIAELYVKLSGTMPLHCISFTRSIAFCQSLFLAQAAIAGL